MEGFGPLNGTPVQMNTVIAGRNAVAVDRVGLHIMDIPQLAVRHLHYMAQGELAPSIFRMLLSLAMHRLSGDLVYRLLRRHSIHRA